MLLYICMTQAHTPLAYPQNGKNRHRPPPTKNLAEICTALKTQEQCPSQRTFNHSQHMTQADEQAMRPRRVTQPPRTAEAPPESRTTRRTRPYAVMLAFITTMPTVRSPRTRLSAMPQYRPPFAHPARAVASLPPRASPDRPPTDRAHASLPDALAALPHTERAALSEIPAHASQSRDSNSSSLPLPLPSPLPSPSPPPTPLWPRALVLLVAAIFGTNFPVVKFLQTGTLPLVASTAALARFSIATVALLPAVRSESRRAAGLPDGLVTAAMLTGLPVTAGYFTQALSLDGTDAGKSAFLCSLAVVFVPLLQRALPFLRADRGDDASPWITWGAPLLAVVGVGFLELSGAAAPTSADAWGVLQAVAFGMGFIMNERAAKRFPGFSLTISAIQLAVVSALSAVWATGELSALAHALTLPRISDMMTDPTNCLGLLYTGLVSTSLAVVLSNIALAHVSAGELTVLYSTEPIWAAVFAAVALDERMGGGALVGGVVILAACLLNQTKRLPADRLKKHFRKLVSSPWAGFATSLSCLSAFINRLHPPSS